MFPASALSSDDIRAGFDRLWLPQHFETSKLWVAHDFFDPTGLWRPEAVLEWLERRCDFATTLVLKRSDKMPEPVRVGSFAEARAAWTEKLSLQINNFHHCLTEDPLLRLIGAAEQSMRMPIEATNLFLTPPGQKATRTHLDDFDLLTVQTFGRKEWGIWHTNLLRDCVEDKPDEVVSLKAGSVFYLPACQPHSVVASTEASVSIGCAFRRRMFKQLLERLCQHPEIAQHLKKNLPPLTSGNVLIENWQATVAALANIDPMKVLRAAMTIRREGPKEP